MLSSTSGSSSRSFFKKQAETGDLRAKHLSDLLEDDSNLLLMIFVRNVLHSVAPVNLAFESTEADVTKLFIDLRNLTFTLAGRILYTTALPQTERPGALRVDEVSALRDALLRPDNLLPVDRINLGDAFRTALQCMKIEQGKLLKVHKFCGSYLFRLCLQLVERLPPNLHVVSKIRYLAPPLVLARVGRPTFQQLPLEFLDK